MTIADRVAEMHAAAAAEPPDEVMSAFGREQAELASTGLPAGSPPSGRSSPTPTCLTRTVPAPPFTPPRAAQRRYLPRRGALLEGLLRATSRSYFP